MGKFKNRNLPEILQIFNALIIQTGIHVVFNIYHQLYRKE